MKTLKEAIYEYDMVMCSTYDDSDPHGSEGSDDYAGGPDGTDTSGGRDWD